MAWWRHQRDTFPRYWPFVRGIHRSPVNSPHKGQRRGALMFSMICAWINSWVSNRDAGDLRRRRAHYDVTVMEWIISSDKRTSGIHIGLLINLIIYPVNLPFLLVALKRLFAGVILRAELICNAISHTPVPRTSLLDAGICPTQIYKNCWERDWELTQPTPGVIDCFDIWFTLY